MYLTYPIKLRCGDTVCYKCAQDKQCIRCKKPVDIAGVDEDVKQFMMSQQYRCPCDKCTQSGSFDVIVEHLKLCEYAANDFIDNPKLYAPLYTKHLENHKAMLENVQHCIQELSATQQPQTVPDDAILQQVTDTLMQVYGSDVQQISQSGQTYESLVNMLLDKMLILGKAQESKTKEV